MPGRPGVRGPGRVPVGSGPRRCSNGRAGSAPGAACRPPGLPGCCGRMGCPGRGPLGRSREMSGSGPRFPVGKGPRFPVGKGRPAVAGRSGAPGRPGAAAAGRAVDGCVAAGATGRAACVAGCEAGAAGRIGVGAVVGAAGFVAAGVAGAGAGALGTILGTLGTALGGTAG